MGDREAEHLERALRQALNHLGDTNFLRQSALVPLLGVQDASDPASALRAVMEQAIGALKPVSDTGLCSRTGRYYEILFRRYVRQLTQRAVADHLAITPRHLRREQATAIRVLAGYLALRFDLAGERVQISMPSMRTGATGDPEFNREMLWLADSLHDQTSEVESVLRQALELVQELAQQHAVHCQWGYTPTVPPVCMPQTVLKQIVLNLLTAVIHELPSGGRVELAARPAAEQVTITLAAIGDSGPSWHHAESLDASTTVSRQLAQVFKGDLSISSAGEALAIHVTLPHTDRGILVLAIEDNLDTLQLWRRYTQKTRFTLVEEPDAEQAITRASKLRPDLIVLDIMLPGTDGWEILRRLRTHPVTASIPVIVCTVLPQRELALSLGARDFIQKPATGGQFRAVLERQTSAARLLR